MVVGMGKARWTTWMHLMVTAEEDIETVCQEFGVGHYERGIVSVCI